MKTGTWAWAIGAALTTVVAGGTASGAAIDADDVARVRDCYAANSPRKSSVLGVRLSVQDAVGAETVSRFKLYWRRLRTGERRVMIRFSEPEFLAGAGLLVEGVRRTRPGSTSTCRTWEHRGG